MGHQRYFIGLVLSNGVYKNCIHSPNLTNLAHRPATKTLFFPCGHFGFCYICVGVFPVIDGRCLGVVKPQGGQQMDLGCEAPQSVCVHSQQQVNVGNLETLSLLSFSTPGCVCLVLPIGVFPSL